VGWQNLREKDSPIPSSNQKREKAKQSFQNGELFRRSFIREMTSPINPVDQTSTSTTVRSMNMTGGKKEQRRGGEKNRAYFYFDS
jgi:hypothetical protein